MSDLKTKKTTASVSKYLNAIEDPVKKKSSKDIVNMMKDVTGMKPTMWGDSIIGFGSYHYKYASGREGDWPITGFSPRKQYLVIYIMPGFKKFEKLMKKLGKYKTGSSCLYIKKVEDIDMKILKELVKKSVKEMNKMYPS